MRAGQGVELRQEETMPLVFPTFINEVGACFPKGNIFQNFQPTEDENIEKRKHINLAQLKILWQ